MAPTTLNFREGSPLNTPARRTSLSRRPPSNDKLATTPTRVPPRLLSAYGTPCKTPSFKPSSAKKRRRQSSSTEPMPQIVVCVRKRPLDGSLSQGRDIMHASGAQCAIECSRPGLDGLSRDVGSMDFQFDHVFDSSASNQHVSLPRSNDG
jgi:hypothetical protein